MTADEGMTYEKAIAWSRANWASENFDRNKYAEAKGFLAGRSSVLDSEEVRGLVEALESMRCHCAGPEHYCAEPKAADLAEDALKLQGKP